MNINKKNIIITSIISFFIIQTNLIAQDANQLVWPSPPNEPKIEFLKSFSSSKHVRAKKSFLRKMWDRVIGHDPMKEMLVQPIGISGDQKGNIYVTDPGMDCVHIFNPTKKIYSQIGGNKNTRFKTPIGVAVSDSGFIYISDSELGEIQVFNAERHYQFTIKGYFQRPTGICINSNILYVTDTELHKVFSFNLDGVYLFEYGNLGLNSGDFNRPIFITKKDMFYITDAMNFRIQVLDEGFNNILSIGHQGNVQGTFSRPKGVAVDSEQNIYVVDGLFDVVQIFNYVGELLLVFGNSGIGLGEFDMPAGIYIDESDQIYVVDTLNRRVQVFKYIK